jgi:hypothetical protein
MAVDLEAKSVPSADGRAERWRRDSRGFVQLTAI